MVIASRICKQFLLFLYMIFELLFRTLLISYVYRNHPVYDTQNIQFRKNDVSLVTSDNKTSYVRHERTSVMNNRTIFRRS